MSRMGESVDATLQIRILHVPDCPLVDRLEATVVAACDELGIQPDITLEVGDYPSPTLLVGGDVMTGQAPEGAARCRLDLPSRESIVSACRRARIPSPGTATPTAEQPERD